MNDYENDGERFQMLWEEAQSELDISEIDSNEEDDNLNISDNLSDTGESESSSVEFDEDMPLDDLLNFYHGKDKITRWHKEPLPVKTEQTKKIYIPGVQKDAKNATSPFESWKLFFTDEIIEEIVKNTNLYIRIIRVRYGRERDAKDTDAVEVQTVIGLLYLAGVLRSSHANLRDLWSNDGTGIEIFRHIMPLRRFEFLLRCLHFDDVNDREERKKVDKLAPIRKILELFLVRCQKNYIVGDHLTIDEMLEPFRGKCSFRQYMKGKRAKYGIKVFYLVDSRTYYTYNMEISTGKQPSGPFCFDNSGFGIVKRLTLPIQNSERNITMNNRFTSIPLMKNLLSDKITIVGCLKHNKKEIPAKFVNAKNRKVKSSLFGFMEEGTLVSYVPKKDNVVTIVSSMHFDDKADESMKDKKPNIVAFYNKAKVTVVKVDELKSTYSVARKSGRWSLTIFFGLLNIAGINSQIIFESNTQSNLIRREFLKSLSLSLSRDYLERRVKSERLPYAMSSRICTILEIDEPMLAKHTLAATVTRGRCCICSARKNRKTKTSCKQCNKFICREHTVNYCAKCEYKNSQYESE